jgi:hypothetical protein
MFVDLIIKRIHDEGRNITAHAVGDDDMLNDGFQKAMTSLHEDLTNLFENFYPCVRKLLNLIMRDTGNTFEGLLDILYEGVGWPNPDKMNISCINWFHRVNIQNFTTS